MEWEERSRGRRDIDVEWIIFKKGFSEHLY